MSYIRNKLLEQAPELHQALLRSWDIALNEWLPAVELRGDSFNSYPHLRNIENHLNTLFQSIDAMEENIPFKNLSSIELYILLNAVLFHDIGKCIKTDDHAKTSNEIVINHWAKLGILSYQLSKIIGDICHYHDPKEPKDVAPLYTTTLDNYGEIRVRKLAILLVLGDHMDSAYTRVMPIYLKPHQNYEPIGAFRKLINGVYVDIDARMVKTVLGDWSPKKNSQINTDIIYIFNLNNSISFQEFIAFLIKYKFKSSIKNLKEFNSHHDSWLKENCKIPSQNIDKIKKIENQLISNLQTEKSFIKEKYGTDILNSNLMRHYFGKKSDNHLLPLIIEKLIFTEKSKKSSWPLDIILCIIIGDIHNNLNALMNIRRELASAGLPIMTWLIEHDERLYNIKGEQTLEPIFDNNYLINIAECMWRLSTQIFGSSMFSYEELSAEARDPDIKRIKMAVKRISIIANSTPLDHNEKSIYPFWFSSTHWQWEVIPAKENSDKCHFIGIKELITEIKMLGDPINVQ